MHSGTQAGGVEVWCGAGSVWRRGYGDSRAVAWGGAALAPALKLKPGAFGFMAAVSLNTTWTAKLAVKVGGNITERVTLKHDTVHNGFLQTPNCAYTPGKFQPPKSLRITVEF